MKKGQTIVMLMVFMAIAITVTTAAVAISITNSQANLKIQTSSEALSVAESGMENALIRLLRDPTYTGETLPVSDGLATITISGSSPVTITSVGTMGDYVRTVRVTGSFVGVIFNISSWTQVY
jgi:hypothetical protein